MTSNDISPWSKEKAPRSLLYKISPSLDQNTDGIKRRTLNTLSPTYTLNRVLSRISSNLAQELIATDAGTENAQT